MRTESEIHDIISQAMYDAMDKAWDSLPQEEKDYYRLNIRGLEMYISRKKWAKP